MFSISFSRKIWSTNVIKVSCLALASKLLLSIAVVWFPREKFDWSSCAAAFLGPVTYPVVNWFDRVKELST
jgi:hypothetical protein